MRVFVVGASGAIGTRLVPQLVDRGHEVIGTFMSPGNAERVRALGAEPIALDLLDRGAVRKAVLEVAPDAIIHQATALANARLSRKFDRIFTQTNLLRTDGTDNLVAAAREAGVSQFVAQSFASMRYARDGVPVKSEDDPLDQNRLHPRASCTPRCGISSGRSPMPVGSRFDTAASTVLPTTG
jgi:nucleoside-diphosphate-sugar epimerase